MSSSRLNDLTSVVLGSSRSSFIHTICKFVRDVDDMNDTVLVPSMLTDLNKCSSPKATSSSSSPDLSDCFDLQTLHQLLNRLKDELTIARFDDDNSNSSSSSSSANILSSAINCNSPTTITTTNNMITNSITTISPSSILTTPSSSSTTNNVNNSNQIASSSSSSSCSLRIAEGDLTGLSKKLHSCKCSGSSDDGFSSLNSFSRNSDDESTSSSSPASDSDSECCSSSSSAPNQSRENDASSVAESSPEYIVNLLKLHIQGIQSILTRFSKYADHVSDSYVNSLD
ncbi:uncharacterized protein DDB_G0271670-like [Panonychus citri]|uniref:uncharacterized protein DDB_G0271670-like n=1 Tax=Panonychus citri TaxID=50023 RepID=UPI0023077786|nr:uncharacterized protein DDB_G0271670-like [Panonychus citri]